MKVGQQWPNLTLISNSSSWSSTSSFILTSVTVKTKIKKTNFLKKAIHVNPLKLQNNSQRWTWSDTHLPEALQQVSLNYLKRWQSRKLTFIFFEVQKLQWKQVNNDQSWTWSETHHPKAGLQVSLQYVWRWKRKISKTYFSQRAITPVKEGNYNLSNSLPWSSEVSLHYLKRWQRKVLSISQLLSFIKIHVPLFLDRKLKK